MNPTPDRDYITICGISGSTRRLYNITVKPLPKQENKGNTLM